MHGQVLEAARRMEGSLAAERAAGEASRDEGAALLCQLEARGELLAQRELETLEAEQRRAAAEAQKSAQLRGRAQRAVGRRALAQRRQKVLSQCWRALCLNAAARQLLRDRDRFRTLMAQQGMRVVIDA